MECVGSLKNIKTNNLTDKFYNAQIFYLCVHQQSTVGFN